MLQRAPNEIWGPAPRNCMHTSDTTAGVHGSPAQKPSARCGCLAPLRPAPLPPLLLQPAAAHLEGVEEVPEGPGVDDVVVRAEEEGHHHAGHACRDRTRGPEKHAEPGPAAGPALPGRAAVGPGTASAKGRSALCCPPRLLGREAGGATAALCSATSGPLRRRGANTQRPSEAAATKRWSWDSGLASPTPDATAARSSACLQRGHRRRTLLGGGGAGLGAVSGAEGTGAALRRPGLRGTSRAAGGPGAERGGLESQCAPPGPGPAPRPLLGSPLPHPAWQSWLVNIHQHPRLAATAGVFPIRPQTLPWRSPL